MGVKRKQILPRSGSPDTIVMTDVPASVEKLEAQTAAKKIVRKAIGLDDYQALVNELLNEELPSLGVETGFVWVQGETRTNVPIVNADHSHHIEVNEPGPTIWGDDLAKLMQKVKELARSGDSWVQAAIDKIANGSEI